MTIRFEFEDVKHELQLAKFFKLNLIDETCVDAESYKQEIRDDLWRKGFHDFDVGNGGSVRLYLVDPEVNRATQAASKRS